MSWLRLFVLWIAMFSVPFQGHAAATMAFCGGGHAAGVASMAAGIRPEVHAHEQAHGHAEKPLPPGNGTHAAHDTAPTDTPSDTAHQCATCGACHATALTDPVRTLAVHGLPPADLAEPAFALTTLAARVPDKPPRA